MFELRFSLRLFAFRLLLLLLAPKLARAISMTTKPMPMMKMAASPPKIHQTAFDFLRGAGAGVGDHCGCGGGGGGGGVGVVGLAVTGGVGR